MIEHALPQLAAPQGWEAAAACADAPTELFFVEQRAAEQAAKAVCAGCPVVNQCRQFGIDGGAAMFGVWGGLSRRERGKLRRADRRVDGAA